MPSWVKGLVNANTPTAHQFGRGRFQESQLESILIAMAIVIVGWVAP